MEKSPVLIATAELFNKFYENSLFIKYLNAKGISEDERENNILTNDSNHQVNFILWLVETGRIKLII